MKKRVDVGALLRDAILGGQDGLVNVLGIILGVAAATQSSQIVIISGLAALFAESISMGAVAYTSLKAARDYYHAELDQATAQVTRAPTKTRRQLTKIFSKKGVHGKSLTAVVSSFMKRPKIAAETLVEDKVDFNPGEKTSPLHSGLFVLFATLIGSIIPLLPFFWLELWSAVGVSMVFSSIMLYIAGVIKAKLTYGNEFRSGLEMVCIGMAAAITGFIIGEILHRTFT
jgi:vacuolar iron transporter family protein